MVRVGGGYGIVVVLVVWGLWAGSALGAAKKEKAAPPKPPPIATPADLNDLSMRVRAMEALYELDLSPAQMTVLRGMAGMTGVADVRQRTAAKGTAKLTSTLKDLHEALARDDVEKVSDLRVALDDAEDDDAVDLDDDVKATEASRSRAADALKMLKAGQIAAYLAEHADEVTDPVELMIDALAEIRDPDAEDVDAEIADTADEVGRLVAGVDAAKAKALSERVTVWLKNAKALKDEEYAARRDALEAAARRIVGEVAPMQVLTHWLENEMADLIANPQLTGAIDAMAAGKKQ
jgi:hypothetical protein